MSGYEYPDTTETLRASERGKRCAERLLDVDDEAAAFFRELDGCASFLRGLIAGAVGSSLAPATVAKCITISLALDDYFTARRHEYADRVEHERLLATRNAGIIARNVAGEVRAE